MVELKEYPGTSHHQAMLRSIASYYENDPRILAVAVFGSLGRGNWDRYSDLDLDVVVADGVKIEIEAEMVSLCASFAPLDEQIALLIPYEEDADVVFRSMMELSIRYHPLSSTSPDITDSLLLLSGRIDRSAIVTAGFANRKPDSEPLARDLDRCIRYALEVDSALQRGYRWSAIELVHYTRRSMMALFTRSQHGQRAYQYFEKAADQDLQLQLGGTLPHYDLKSIQQALVQILDILANDLDKLTGGKVILTELQKELLAKIRSRQADLNF